MKCAGLQTRSQKHVHYVTATLKMGNGADEADVILASGDDEGVRNETKLEA